MKYCSSCGESLSERIPEMDNRIRHVCDSCGQIHYQNPRIVVGCLPVWEGRVLLCKRAIEPRRGFWTLPAGFMENGETTLAGALRETREEANAQIHHTELYRLYDLPHINQVYMFYRGEIAEGRFAPGDESLAVELFTEAQVPWDELAFPVVRHALEDFFRDCKRGEFSISVTDFSPQRLARKNTTGGQGSAE